MKLFRSIVCTMLALTLCLGMAATASAAVKETAANLFREDKAPDEDYATIRVKDEEDDEYYDRVDVDLIYRSMKSDITIAKDAKLIESVKLTVGKNATLTVEEGATLTVLGELVVEGTLINRGTIIVGVKDTPRYEGYGDMDERDQLKRYVTRLAISNKGTVRNAGTMNIRNGYVTNYAKAIFENSGKMTITNTDANSVGLKNLARKEDGVTIFGEITNSGTITVSNTTGTGIHNYNGAKFQNSGDILVSKKGTIKGKISGNQPTATK